jgi:hypothetical protein
MVQAYLCSMVQLLMGGSTACPSEFDATFKLVQQPRPSNQSAGLCIH